MRTFQFQVTEYDLERYAEVSEDRNPLHLNEKYAKEAGYSGKIAHGMLTMAKVVSIVANECFNSNQFIKSYEFIFLAPVYVDDIIEMQVMGEGQPYHIRGICGDHFILKGKVLCENRQSL